MPHCRRSRQTDGNADRPRQCMRVFSHQQNRRIFMWPEATQPSGMSGAMMVQSSHSTPESLPPTTPVPKRRWGLTMLWLGPLLFLAAVLIYGLLTKGPTNTTDAGPQVGQPLADFALADLQGRAMQLSALRGSVVFIN